MCSFLPELVWTTAAACLECASGSMDVFSFLHKLGPVSWECFPKCALQGGGDLITPVLTSKYLMFMWEISRAYPIALGGEKNHQESWTIQHQHPRTKCNFSFLKLLFSLLYRPTFGNFLDMSFWIWIQLCSGKMLCPRCHWPAVVSPQNPFSFLIFSSISRLRKPSGLHLCHAH